MALSRVASTTIFGTSIVSIAAAAAVAIQAEPVQSGSPLLDPAYVAQHVCGPIKRKAEFFNPGFQIAAAQAAAESAAPDEGRVIFDNLGTLSEPVTTRAPEAQRYFDQGLRFAYAFNHGEAARAFRQAQAIDPTCAMCYWGEAWVLGPNINYAMQPEAVAPAFAAIAQAMALAGSASERERALIGALSARYSADPTTDRKVLDAAYADAMANVAAKFPDDDQAQVLFADALMNLQPWDYWAADKRTPKGRTAEQVAALERVLQRNPNHPGAIHLYIHTVEATTTPGRAEPYADRLNGQMPGAGHLVHMPAHIYYRVGRYLDSLKVNLAATAADEALFTSAQQQPVYRYGYYPHNIHFVLVSARMAGDRANAISAAEKLSQVIPNDLTTLVGLVQPIRQAPYFAHAQLSPPATVLALPDPGAGFPFVQGSWRYARALAQIRAGDLQVAAEERRQLGELTERSDFSELAAWFVPAKEVLTIAGKVVDGQMARAAGNYAQAEALFREAAMLQDALPYMEPPYWYYPIRQSLAATQLEAGKPEEAVESFQGSLMEAPSNAYALYGLMLAQEKAGDAVGAAATKALFTKAWAGGTILPTLTEL